MCPDDISTCKCRFAPHHPDQRAACDRASGFTVSEVPMCRECAALALASCAVVAALHEVASVV